MGAALLARRGFRAAQVAVNDLGPRAWAIADALGWAKTYDAEYVALAQFVDCSLLTLDARLARGASAVVRTIGPDQV